MWGFKINVSIIIKSFQTSCPINHFSFYSTNIYIVKNDNQTGVKDLNLSLLLIKIKLYMTKKKLSVPITTNVVSSNPTQARCTRYNIM
jgi:hypothetical protein